MNWTFDHHEDDIKANEEIKSNRIDNKTMSNNNNNNHASLLKEYTTSTQPSTITGPPTKKRKLNVEQRKQPSDKKTEPITVPPPPLENIQKSTNKMSIAPKQPSKSPSISRSPMSMKIPKMNHENTDNNNADTPKNTNKKVNVNNIKNTANNKSKMEVDSKEETKKNGTKTQDMQSNIPILKKKRFKRAVNLKSNKARC